MKNIKKLGLMLAMLAIGNASLAQRGVKYTLRYSADNARYEAYAKPNFTKKNFFWGPSQITVVLPEAAANEQIRVITADAGTWDDNTRVFAPKAMPTADFHAVATLGAKTDLIEDQETLLFHFTLSTKLNTDEVRLFENEKDPSSSAAGMLGGDYGNNLSDPLADDIYLGNYYDKKTTSPKVENPINTLEVDDKNLVVFPNTTKEDFNVSLKGISKEEEVTLVVLTELGKEIMRIKSTKEALENKTFKIPVHIASQNLVVRVQGEKTVFGRKLILDRE